MVTVEKTESVPIQSSADIVLVRQRVRASAVEMQYTLVDQTKLVTAASELARNTLEHGKGGSMRIETLANGVRKGLRLTFADKGPGIADINQALRDGYSTGTGMGLGLSGSRRLVNEFDIQSAPGQGTTVTVTRWK